MTPREKAINVVERELGDPCYSAEGIAWQAGAIVDEIAPLLTADMQARLDAAEARERQAVEAERERCAKVVKTYLQGEIIAAAIRTGAKP